MSTILIRSLGALALSVVAASSGVAQQTPTPAPQLVTIKPLVVIPMTGDEKKEVVSLSLSIQPTGAISMHVHPGDCVGSVIEGAVEFLVEGQAPRRLAAGDAYSTERGTAHGFRNVGDTQARLLNTMVVDRGSPRTQPAAQPPKQ